MINKTWLTWPICLCTGRSRDVDAARGMTGDDLYPGRVRSDLYPTYADTPYSRIRPCAPSAGRVKVGRARGDTPLLVSPLGVRHGTKPHNKQSQRWTLTMLSTTNELWMNSPMIGHRQHGNTWWNWRASRSIVTTQWVGQFFEHLINNTWAHDGELFKTRIVFMIQINKCMTTLDCNAEELWYTWTVLTDYVLITAWPHLRLYYSYRLVHDHTWVKWILMDPYCVGVT